MTYKGKDDREGSNLCLRTLIVFIEVYGNDTRTPLHSLVDYTNKLRLLTFLMHEPCECKEVVVSQ